MLYWNLPFGKLICRTAVWKQLICRMQSGKNCSQSLTHEIRNSCAYHITALFSNALSQPSRLKTSNMPMGKTSKFALFLLPQMKTWMQFLIKHLSAHSFLMAPNNLIPGSKSPSWEANSYSSSQEMHYISWNVTVTTIFTRTHHLTLSPARQIQSTTPLPHPPFHFLTIQFTTTLPSMPRSSK